MYLFNFNRSSYNQFKTCQARLHAAANSRGVSPLVSVLRAENDRRLVPRTWHFNIYTLLPHNYQSLCPFV